MSERRGQVIVVGSINVDLVVRVARLPGPGETVASGTLERHGGGKGANQAVAAARAGAQVRLIGAIGDDDFGSSALAELAAEGVDTSGVTTIAGQPTGVAAITVDEDGENQIAVASGANAALGAAAVTDALASLAIAPGAVVLLSFELGDEPLDAAARWAREHELAWVLANPAPARPLSAALLAAAPVLTPNAGELARLAGAAGETEPAARALGARTGGPVIVTLGAGGALLVRDGAAQRFAAPVVTAIDSTGAGDAFNGALAAALARGERLAGAVARGVEAGAAAVQGRGARFSPDR